MKSNRNKKILIIIVILVTIIIGTGVTFTFLKTDLLKSNKEMFFRYITQIGDEDLNKYFEKIQNTGYENNGEFWVDITKNGEKLETLKNLNNFSIAFDGKVDIANNKGEQTININYSNELSIPITYRQINKILGIKNKYLSKTKFFAIEEGKDEIKGEELSIPTISISKETTIQKNSGDSVVIEKYLSILNENLKESDFSRENNNGLAIYKLTTKPEAMQATILQLLNTLSSDESALKLISEDTNIAKNYVNGIINFVGDFSIEGNDNITIAVTEKNKILNSIEIKYKDINIAIKKNKSENELEYEISVKSSEDENANAYLTIKYSGLKMMERIDETYELGFNIPYIESKKENSGSKTEGNNQEYEDIKLSVKQEKEKIEFLIADAKSNRMLNNENVENLTYDNIQKTLETKTDSSYTRMELEKESDTSYNLTFTDTNDKFTIDASGKIIKEPNQNANSNTPVDASNDEVEDLTDNQDTNNQSNVEQENSENYENDINNAGEKKDYFNYVYKLANSNLFVNSVEIEEFTDENSIILTKKEEEYNKKLLKKIIERIIAVNNAAMKKIGATSELQNPIILLIPGSIINGQQMNSSNENLSEVEIKTFNDKFKIYESTNQTGASTKGLLTVIQNNNSEQEGSKNKIREISFDGQNYEANEQNITLVKSSIDTAKNYKVEFEAEENTGLIYRAVINVK